MTAFRFGADGIDVSVDLSVGHIADLAIRFDVGVLHPLHRAPWLDESPELLPPGLSNGQRRLSGEFLCAPFSASAVEPAPLHGWSANSPWDVISSETVFGGWQARLRLRRKVLGATVEKILTVRDGHPFLYQEHVFTGGAGALSIAHHPMTAMKQGGSLAFSPKRFAMTPPGAPEPDPTRGRSMLAYPARTEKLDSFPVAGGGSMSLLEYRDGDLREDFVTLVEAPHGGIGWTAVARHQEGDLFLVLKNPIDLPVTMLWTSNGGRDYAPWSGRHRGVLGVEDGRTAVGHAASIGDNDLRREGVPTTFQLGGEARFRHVVGALSLERSGVPPKTVEPAGDLLRLTFAAGGDIEVPFDTAFLAEPLLPLG